MRQIALPRRRELTDHAEPSSRRGCAAAHVSKRSNAATSRSTAGSTSAARALDISPTACWHERGTMHQGESEELRHLHRDVATRGSSQWHERGHGRGVRGTNCLGTGKRVGGDRRGAPRAWLSTKGCRTGVAVTEAVPLRRSGCRLDGPDASESPAAAGGACRLVGARRPGMLSVAPGRVRSALRRGDSRT